MEYILNYAPCENREIKFHVKLEEIQKGYRSASFHLKAYNQFGNCDSSRIIFEKGGCRINFDRVTTIFQPDDYNVPEKQE